MSGVWFVVGGVAIVCAVIRLAVPLALGERHFPRLTMRSTSPSRRYWPRSW
ncbi:MAG: hypothetical protein M3R48_02955 [Candidatus Dormibacteraeota bacterium]|nr:hypothetical protein [Candidatus Dormibacteraeota bacterium]